MEALVAMVVASELGSLSAAAAELGITHGSVSRRISSLEGWLGQPIFERHGRGVVLTTAGELLVRRTERSLGAISALAADLRTGGRHGVIRVSVLPSLARLWVMPNFGKLLGTPPDLSVSIVAEHRVAGLDRRDADVAIRSGAGSWSGADSRLLFSERIYPLASPGLAAELAGAKIGDLDGARLIHDTDSTGWRHWNRETGATIRPGGKELRFDDYDLALSAAAQGLGIVLGRWPLSRAMEESGALVRLSKTTIGSASGVYLVLRHGEARTAVLRLAERLKLAAKETALTSGQ